MRIAVISLLAALLASFGGGSQTDTFTVRIVCQSPGVSQILYTACVDGQSRAMGGMADLDGTVLSPDSELMLTVPRSWFAPEDDLGAFSLELTLYGPDDPQPLGTAPPVAIPAVYGGSYTLLLTGDGAAGFRAWLERGATGQKNSTQGTPSRAPVPSPRQGPPLF